MIGFGTVLFLMSCQRCHAQAACLFLFLDTRYCTQEAYMFKIQEKKSATDCVKLWFGLGNAFQCFSVIYIFFFLTGRKMVAGRHCYSCKTSRKGDLLGNGSPFSFESCVRSGMGGSASQWVPYAFSGWTFSCTEEIWRTSKWEISWLPFLIFALI